MIESLLKSDNAELTQSTKKGAPVVLSTRLRLARNLVGVPFPERASNSQRSDVMTRCADQIAELTQMKHGAFFDIAELSDLEKQVLVERHLISRELCESKSGSGVFINKDQTCSIMINEEDHLRIQFLKTGFSLRSVWKQIDRFDSSLENDDYRSFAHNFASLGVSLIIKFTRNIRMSFGVSKRKDLNANDNNRPVGFENLDAVSIFNHIYMVKF